MIIQRKPKAAVARHSFERKRQTRFFDADLDIFTLTCLKERDTKSDYTK